jgi:hypothetical protein
MLSERRANQTLPESEDLAFPTTKRNAVLTAEDTNGTKDRNFG